jgi:hypothetical protein
MCVSKPKIPHVAPTPLPPPPPQETALAPVIDPTVKGRLGVAAKRRGLNSLRIPLTNGVSGLNVPQG